MSILLYVRMAMIMMLFAMPVLGQTPTIETLDQTQKVAILQRQVAKLQSENDSLRREIKTLRQRLPPADTAPTTQPEATSSAPVAKPVSNVVPPPAAGSAQETGYWLTASSGKRHNKACRYYENSKGRSCGPGEGAACKICGG